MFCPHCGKENKDTSLFCAGCGKQLKNAASVSNANVPTITKPAKVNAPLIKKETMSQIILAAIIVLLFAGVFVLFLLLLNKEDAVSVSTLFDSSVKGTVSLKEILNILISGNKVFNPTVISAAIGIGIYIFIYSIPIFALISLIATISNKKSLALYIVSTIITVLSAATSVLVTPISVLIIPGFKQAVAATAGVMFNDINSIIFIPTIVFASIIVVLTVIIGILIGIFGKRRAKKDEQ